MAAYPNIAQDLDSTETVLDDVQVDRATNGAPRVRALYTALKREFSVVHRWATGAEKASVEAFYAANRLVSFTFVWKGDGATYTCCFAGAPNYKPLRGGTWEIVVRMVQL